MGEFKPISRNKRLVANQNCREKNISKFKNADGRNSENEDSWRLSEKTGFKDNGFDEDSGLYQKYDDYEITENQLWPSYHNSYSNNSSSPATQNKSIFDVINESSESDGG